MDITTFGEGTLKDYGFVLLCNVSQYVIWGVDKMSACILAIFVVVVQLLCVLFGCKYWRYKVRAK
jgi:hypothetical protein